MLRWWIRSSYAAIEVSDRDKTALRTVKCVKEDRVEMV